MGKHKLVCVGELGVKNCFTYGSQEWVVLENTDSGVLSISLNVHKDPINGTHGLPFNCKNINDFTISTALALLKGLFYTGLIDNGAMADDFLPIGLDLSAADDSGGYGNINVKLGLLTLEMFRRFANIIPPTGCNWWLCTPLSTAEAESEQFVCIVGACNQVGFEFANSFDPRIRHICYLKRQTQVEVK